MTPAAPAVPETPEALLARWQGTGDGAALGALFDATAGDLFRIALAVAPDPAAAEDALQETFLALLESAGRFDAGRPVMPLLVGILRHKVAKVRRRVVRAPDPRRVDPSLPVEDPGAAAARGEDAERVRAAILALPETYRKAALLRWSHGLEPAEIAEILEKPPGTVWSLLSRAREILARALTGSPLAVAMGAPSPRGLGAVREAVLRRVAARAAAASGAAAAAAAGGVLVGKKAVAAVAAMALLLLAGGGAWIAFAPEEEAPGERTRSGSAAALPRLAPAPAVEAVPTKEDTAAAPTARPDSEPAPEAPPIPPERAGVFGTVVDGERGPVEGARVTVRAADGQVVERRTDAGGAFAFEPFPVRASGHMVHHYLATDGKGRCARSSLYMFASPAPGEEFLLGGCGMGPMVLRPGSAVEVLVTSGGAPAAGASVWAEEEGPYRPRTEILLTDEAGRARLEWISEGRWTVHAEAPGAGRGRARVAAPAAAPVEVALVSRTLEVEVVEEGSGTPVEGVGLFVWTRRHDGAEEIWDDEWPPPPIAPTDSAGRTRLLGRGAEAFRLAAILPGEDEPRNGAPRIDVEPTAVLARVPLRRGRTVRWAIRDGERPPPVDGAEVLVGEARTLTDPMLSAILDSPSAGTWGLRKGRIAGRDLVLDGMESAEFHGLARAPDGSLARVHAAAGADRGDTIRFSIPRRLEVVVRDEDGKPVTDSVVVLKDSGGRPQAATIPPDEEGRTVFEGLPTGEVVVCPLARWDLGGAEALRLDLAGGDREVEVVVGRAFPVVARVRVDGKPRLPAEHQFQVLHPIPAGGVAPPEGDPADAVEDASKGEARFHLRSVAPGKPLYLEIVVPGREPVRREVAPPTVGGEAVVEFDL